jgi:hypothetical protein
VDGTELSLLNGREIILKLLAEYPQGLSTAEIAKSFSNESPKVDEILDEVEFRESIHSVPAKDGKTTSVWRLKEDQVRRSECDPVEEKVIEDRIIWERLTWCQG